MARAGRALQASTGSRIQSSRQSSTRARSAIAAYYRVHGPTPVPAGANSPPLERNECICNSDVTRQDAREACWHCHRWHHMEWPVELPSAAAPIDSCIYVWLWPRKNAADLDEGEDPDPYRPCRLCRDLTCHDQAQISARMCPWCAQAFRPTGAQAQARWDAIFRAETFQAYVGRLLMAEGKGGWNLKGRMAEFDPDRFTRCRADLLRGPSGEMPVGGRRLQKKEWERWCNGPRRRFQRMRDVIIYQKNRRGEQGSLTQFQPPSFGVSRINVLAHMLEGDPDWDNFRDMFDDRSRTID